jgi:hypothetical protein
MPLAASDRVRRRGQNDERVAPPGKRRVARSFFEAGYGVEPGPSADPRRRIPPVPGHPPLPAAPSSFGSGS